MIPRKLLPLLDAALIPGQIVVLYGARRVGKTVLAKMIETNRAAEKTLFLNGEDETVVRLLAERSEGNYRRLLEGVDILMLDEAQAIAEVGSKLKFMVDTFPDKKILATGSSSLTLKESAGEPLTGRHRSFVLYPLGIGELAAQENSIETASALAERIVLGGYPALTGMTSWEEKVEYLSGIVSSYLLKDILALDGIRQSGRILDLLKLVAHQIGRDVSYDELAGQLGLSKNTVEKYLDLLTKVFVLARIPAFARNLRNEIRKSHRWYFLDNGIRNAVIGRTAPLPLRDDVGMLWENFLVAERLKRNGWLARRASMHFWRTYAQQEIDIVEYCEGSVSAFECKWSVHKIPRIPTSFHNAYPQASFQTVTPDNYRDFVD